MRLVWPLFMVLLMGCPKATTLRSVEVYKAELQQYNQWATVQAGLLRDFVSNQCECSDIAEFTDPQCTKAADWLLTVEYRAEWHQQMSLYNGSLLDERPDETPPAIPDSSCPLPPPPDEAPEPDETPPEEIAPEVAPAETEAAPEAEVTP